MNVKSIMTMVIRTAKIVIVGFLVIGMVYAMTNGMVKDYFEDTVGAVVSKAEEMSGAAGSSSGSSGNYEATFADNTWAEIAKACQSNAVPSTWKVGDTKEMEINGTSYTVAIIGKNHDTYADGSGKAPLTFQVIDIVTTAQMNSTKTNSGSWDGSAMYSYLQNSMLNSLETDVKSNIKAVSKKTNLGGADLDLNNIVAKTKTSSNKLFLLSDVEVSGSALWDYYLELELEGETNQDTIKIYNYIVDSIKAEGTQYDYYKPDGSETDKDELNYYYNFNKATLKYNGVASAWWLRSPIPYDFNSFYCVAASGDGNTDYATAALGVSFGFCF